MVLFSATIKEPLDYISLGIKKPKKYYLNANLFYGGGLNSFVQKDILQKVKFFLYEHLKSCPKIENFPISIEIIFVRKNKTTWDLDNKGYFWHKIICDYLVELGKIPKDNINHINGLKWYAATGEPEIKLTISTENKDITFVS